MQDYAFPVALEKVYLQSNKELPFMRAVVRKDTEEAIAKVSDKYQLVKHDLVVESAEKFIKLFGEPQRKFYMAKNGAHLVAEFTYREQQYMKQVQKGDIVGLKIFVENSYNTKSAVRVQIGALVLSCLNGMVTPKSFFSYSYRHVNSQLKIEFPDPAMVLGAYNRQTELWRSYAERSLSEVDMSYQTIIEIAELREIISGEGKDRLLLKSADTYWDLMQNLTYEATHLGGSMPIGRLHRMERSARLVEELATKRTLVVEQQPEVIDLY